MESIPLYNLLHPIMGSFLFWFCGHRLMDRSLLINIYLRGWCETKKKKKQELKMLIWTALELSVVRCITAVLSKKCFLSEGDDSSLTDVETMNSGLLWRTVSIFLCRYDRPKPKTWRAAFYHFEKSNGS